MHIFPNQGNEKTRTAKLAQLRNSSWSPVCQASHLIATSVTMPSRPCLLVYLTTLVDLDGLALHLTEWAQSSLGLP